MSRRRRLAWIYCLAGMLAGCATAPPVVRTNTDCSTAGGAPMVVFELFFGRSIHGQGEVTDDAWDDFLNRVVTPNLPNGYTVFDGTGAWLNPTTGRTIRERTKILLAALPDGAASAGAVARVRRAYEVQFGQISVGLTAAPVCGSF